MADAGAATPETPQVPETPQTSQPDFEAWEAAEDAVGTQDALVVSLDGFEGPLDVLLALARTQKVDLAKISVLALADQYLRRNPHFAPEGLSVSVPEGADANRLYPLPGRLQKRLAADQIRRFGIDLDFEFVDLGADDDLRLRALEFRTQRKGVAIRE